MGLDKKNIIIKKWRLKGLFYDIFYFGHTTFLPTTNLKIKRAELNKKKHHVERAFVI